MFFRKPRSPEVFRSSPWTIDALVIAVISGVFVCGRWLSIVYPLPLNPDEAQAAANALRIQGYGFNWDALDGSTDGPLDSLATCWPHLFGWDATLSTTRLTACLLLILISVFTYLAIKTLANRLLALLLLWPMVAFYAFTTNHDFVHYSSELLPMALLTAANGVVVGIAMDRGRGSGVVRYAVLGLLLGAVPFAKLQAAPIGVVVGLYGFFLAVTEPAGGRLRKVLALVCAGLLPACGFLLPLLVSGHIQDFWRSYIAYAFLYVKQPLSIPVLHEMIADDLSLRCMSYFMFALALLTLGNACFALLKRDAAERRAAGYGMVYGILVVVAAFWVISKPGTHFYHYLTFYPAFVAVLCAWNIRAFGSRREDLLPFVAYYVAALLICLNLFKWIPATGDAARILRTSYRTDLSQSFQVRSPHMLSWLPIPATHLLIWGWMPHWYVWSGLTPASRETNTFLQTNPSALQGYFRSRFMSDIGASSPDVIMDAVAGKSFFYSSPEKAGPAVFPEFATYLSSGYTQLPPWRPAPDCAKVYVKNQDKALLDQRLIEPASVTASATYQGDHSQYDVANLFDNSVTEDTCVDYWLLPTRTPGSVDVKFAKAEPVSKVMLLNTHNADYLDRASDRIEVILLKSGTVVGDEQLAMQPFPSWTSVGWDMAVEADEMRVEILSYYGRGGGLNEIKIFRPEDAVKTR